MVGYGKIDINEGFRCVWVDMADNHGQLDVLLVFN